MNIIDTMQHKMNEISEHRSKLDDIINHTFNYHLLSICKECEYANEFFPSITEWRMWFTNILKNKYPYIQDIAFNSNLTIPVYHIEFITENLIFKIQRTDITDDSITVVLKKKNMYQNSSIISLSNNEIQFLNDLCNDFNKTTINLKKYKLNNLKDEIITRTTIGKKKIITD